MPYGRLCEASVAPQRCVVLPYVLAAQLEARAAAPSARQRAGAGPPAQGAKLQPNVADLVLTGHADKAQYALCTSTAAPFVGSGGTDNNVSAPAACLPSSPCHAEMLAVCVVNTCKAAPLVPHQECCAPDSEHCVGAGLGPAGARWGIPAAGQRLQEHRRGSADAVTHAARRQRAAGGSLGAAPGLALHGTRHAFSAASAAG